MTEYLKREDVRRAVLHNEGDAVIAAIDALTVTELQDWIPVTERLPDLTEQVEGDNYLVDYSKDVLVYVNGDPIFTQNIQVGRYQTDNCGGKGFTDEMFEPIHNVTHWMPLPQAPEV